MHNQPKRSTITAAAMTALAIFFIGSCSNLVLESEKVDESFVRADKVKLELGLAPGDTLSSITQDITVPTSIEEGTTVTWTSSDPDAISTDGAVTRPAFDAGSKSVTLTATLVTGTASASKVFSLVVLPVEPTDAEAVAAATAAIAIGYAAGDSAAGIRQNVTLPATGLWGTTVTWSRTAGTAIDPSDGTVTRPAYLAGNTTVSLRATVTKNAESGTKDFNALVVLEQPGTDAECVAEDTTGLAIGYAAGDSNTSVTQGLTLATAGSNGTSISWASNNAVVATNGTVTRPAYASGDVSVTLTATISKAGSSDTKVFTVTVIKLPQTDAEAVADGKASLAITYGGSDTAGSVTVNLASLPATSTSGTSVTWATNDAAHVTAAGIVIRPAYGSSNATVILTATISKGGASDTKTFSLTIIALPPLAVGDAYQGGKIAYILQDGDPGYEAGVTKGLIAATADQSAGIRWATAAFETTAIVAGTWTGLGTGAANTERIIDQNGVGTSYAAGLVRAYAGGGYTDWYLPSVDELHKLYLNKAAIGGFNTGRYLSSSEFNASNAWQKSLNDGNQDSVGKSYTGYSVRAVRSFPATVISSGAIGGITVPAAGATPVTAVTATSQYRGTVSWSGAPATFLGATVYTATITLTPKAGCTVTGVAANSFTVAGATSVTNNADSGVITAVFPETATVDITAASVTGFVTPLTGRAKQAAGTLTAGVASYTVTSMTWSPDMTTYAAETAYTATVVLTSAVGYKFTALTPTINTGTQSVGIVGGGSVSGNTLSFTVTYPQTFWATGMALSQNWGGGLVAYFLVSGDVGYDAAVQHGLIVATADQSTGSPYALAPYQGAVPGGTSTAIGSGSANTDKIIAQNGPGTGYAAGVARAYTGGGYRDWYLPSKDEIYKLYLNNASSGALIGTVNYWSSSDSFTAASRQDFLGGDANYILKENTCRVRAVRSF